MSCQFPHFCDIIMSWVSTFLSNNVQLLKSSVPPNLKLQSYHLRLILPGILLLFKVTLPGHHHPLWRVLIGTREYPLWGVWSEPRYMITGKQETLFHFPSSYFPVVHLEFSYIVANTLRWGTRNMAQIFLSYQLCCGKPMCGTEGCCLALSFFSNSLFLMFK